ncbi:putative nucleic acid-binding protein [Paraburkholderia sp. GAS448]|uniref:type II toxin-antitoxin system VapC family toxin n=1 Tax=Paraburkholderia sp. GAS448 TaxID=3035136 RepID=UPI003D1F716E
MTDDAPFGGYMLDTNVFNDFLDGRIDANRLKGHKLFATHIQRDEINKTRDDARREALLASFAELTTGISPTSSAVAGISVAGAACPAASTSVVPTECGVWGVSEWGQAKWRSERTQFEALREELDGRNRGKPNNVQDVLIAETALQNKMTLLTRDADLRFVAEKFGVLCADATELFGGTGNPSPEPS